MSRKLLIASLFASLVVGAPALAQVGGSAGGTGSVGGGAGGSLGSGSTPTGGGIGSGGTGGGLPLGGSQGMGAAGSGASTTEGRASQGSTTINPLNVDSLARGEGSSLGVGSTLGGAPGTSASTSISGAGPAELYNIPQPTVAVDPTSIRNALAAGSNATPKPDGR